MQSLKELEIQNCEDLDELLPELAKIETLESLTLRKCEIDGQEFRLLKLSKLEHLKKNRCY